MKKLVILIALGLVVILAGVYMLSRPGEPTTTNVDMLDTNQVTEITTKEVAYFPGANGYFVRPADTMAYPGVVMIHENRGLRPETRQAAEMLAKEGYLVLAVDLLGGTAEDQTGARALTAKFKQDVGTANMRAAAQYLRDNGATKIASLGWCFGGRQSVELAISGEKLDATLVYYGGNMATSTERLAPIKWPVLGIFGDQDQAIPVSMVRTFESSLNTLGVTNEIYIYPGVGHAFANPSGANYAPEATKDAWGKTVAFLKKHLSAAPTGQPIGGEREANGCLGPAGYSFDERVGACTRGWELTDDIAAAAKKAVDLVGAGYALTVVKFNSYEEPGAYDIVLERGEERTTQTVYIRNGKASVTTPR